MTRRIPTGIFVEPQEVRNAIQLFGAYSENRTQENMDKKDAYLKLLATKYGYEWTENEIAPNGEVIHVVKEKEDATN